MAPSAWVQGFREMHEKGKRGALAGRELTDYLAARDELARALLAAQRVAVPPGLRPRRALRVARAVQAQLDFGVSTLRATTVELSAAGFAALLPTAPRVGDEAKVVLKLSAAEQLHVCARVVEARQLAGSARVGFAFVALPDEELERLERFVFDAVLAQMQA